MAREELIVAVRAALAGERGITEKKMFGGVGFFLNGNLLVGTGGGGLDGALLVRVGKAGEADALRAPHTRPTEMRGRRIGGYVFVDEAGWRNQAALARWLRRAVEHVGTLPKKEATSTVAKTKRRGSRGRTKLR